MKSDFIWLRAVKEKLVTGVVQWFLFADNFFVPLLFIWKTTGLSLLQEEVFHKEGKIGQSGDEGTSFTLQWTCLWLSWAASGCHWILGLWNLVGNNFKLTHLSCNLLMKIDSCFQSHTGLQNTFGVRGLSFCCSSQGFAYFPLSCQMLTLFKLLNSYFVLYAVLNLRIILLDAVHNSMGHSWPKYLL